MIRKLLALVLPLTMVLSILLHADDAEAKRRRGGGKRGKARRGRVVGIAPIKDGKPNIQAQSALVIDLKTGEELFSKDPDSVRPIASISKLMASLVLLEKGLKLDGEQTITKDDKAVAFKGPIGKLFEGFTFKNVDLLHAALLASDNRALPALGRTLGLSAQQLSEAMTKRAQELGLKNTKFDDPTGLNDGNVSTAREVVQMLRHALANPVIAQILPKKQHEVRALNKPRVITYNNTDKLIGSAQYQVLGGKTGYTDLARYCLVIAARVQGREIGMAFLHAEGKMTRFADFQRVAQWLAAGGPKLAQGKAPASASASASAAASAAAPPAAAPAKAGSL